MLRIQRCTAEYVRFCHNQCSGTSPIKMEGSSLPINAATFSGMADDVGVHSAVNILSLLNLYTFLSLHAISMAVWFNEIISAFAGVNYIPLHVIPASSECRQLYV